MKIAFPAFTEDSNNLIEARFGRAKYFIIYDTETDQFTSIPNQVNLLSPVGAGIQAAQKVIESGAQVVITGHCGPKAFKVLSSAGVKVITGAEGIKIKEALEKYKKGELKPTLEPDVEGHWG